MDRNNHYEAAFEGYLQWHRLPYVGVDETRRSFLGELRVKSLDFIVHGDAGGWLVDVKGRRYPAGTEEQPRRVWESWSTREDVISLRRWAERFGPSYQPLLVFVYEVMPFAKALPDGEDLWTWHGRRYLLRAVAVGDYQEAMVRRSSKWDTVALSSSEYRRLVRPFSSVVRRPSSVDEAAERSEERVVVALGHNHDCKL